jgi:diguanylate cyclase (GGDEF)-like protein
MALGRSKLLSGDVLTGSTPLLRRVERPSGTVAEAEPDFDPEVEIERLRLVNARLLKELAVLRGREAQAQRLADRDALTGLYNRRRLLELLDSLIADAAQSKQCVGMLFIDLNGFKAVNDEYGHPAGDRLLTTVAKRIAARVRTADIVSRYGGDEFVVLLPGVPDEEAVTLVADMIRDRVSLPYRIAGVDQHLTAAIGESIYPYDGDSAEVLLQRADEAMYRLKEYRSRPVQEGDRPLSIRPARRRTDKSKPSLNGGDP